MANQIQFYSKDIQIMRQSQQKMAFDHARSKGIYLTVEELQRVTDVFVECCLRPMDNDLKERVRKMDTWLLKKAREIQEQIEIDGILIN
jgi:hypothetical protein